jgi:glycerate-2-kinase
LNPAFAPSAVIGRFPWDPFPPGEPEPKGPDPLPSLAYRAAVTAADSYRSVRLALRRDSGTLRVGNRFVPDGRYREVAFLAFGHAANSMALGALHAVGDRLTQGFIAGPEPVPQELPFRGVALEPGWGGAPEAPSAVNAATEIASALTEQDLLLVLLSPGALRGLALPPPGMTDEEFSTFLLSAHERGAGGREVMLLARVLGTGGVGGRLALAATRSDVTTFIVDRGDGPASVGGGPMHPVAPAERVEAAALLERLGLRGSIPAAAVDGLTVGGDSGTPLPSRVSRPLLVASPTDALRAAADALFDKGWTTRLAFLEVREGPEASADRFLARTEELLASEGLTAESRTKGLGAFAMMTLGLPEGVDEGPALGRFLVRSQAGLRRREMSLGLFRTAGVVGSDEFPAGAVVGAPTDPAAPTRPGRARATPMRRGVTDVGLLAVALFPTPAPPERRNPKGRGA